MDTTIADARLAIGLAACAALAATLPLIAARAVPSPVRAAFAIVVAPLAATHVHPVGSSPTDVAFAACSAALAGATIGLSAAIVAGVAAAAGALFDVAIAASPAGFDASSRDNHGPLATLLSLAFAGVMISSGAFTRLIAGALEMLAHVNAYGRNAGFVFALGRVIFGWAIGLAFPMIAAYALSSLVAAITARAAPRINGMLLAPALSSAAGLTIALASTPLLVTTFMRLAELSLRAGHAR